MGSGDALTSFQFPVSGFMFSILFSRESPQVLAASLFGQLNLRVRRTARRTVGMPHAKRAAGARIHQLGRGACAEAFRMYAEIVRQPLTARIKRRRVVGED